MSAEGDGEGGGGGGGGLGGGEGSQAAQEKDLGEETSIEGEGKTGSFFFVRCEKESWLARFGSRTF